MTDKGPCDFSNFDHHATNVRVDAETLWSEMRACPGLAKSDKHGSFHLVSRYEDLKKVLLDYETFSSASGITLPDQQIRSNHIPPEVDPPLQREYRRILQPFLTPQKVQERENDVRALAVELLENLKNQREVDFFSTFARPFPVFASLALIGLPREDGPFIDNVVMRLHQEIAANVRTGATDALTKYVKDALNSRQAQEIDPSQDLVCAIAAGSVEGRPLTFDEQVSMLRLLLIGGFDSTSFSIAMAIWQLAQRPDLQERLRSEPALLDKASEEFVRLASPATYLRRTITKPVELSGTQLEKGDRVLLCFGAANRDEKIFDRPDDAIPDRSPNPHLGFGLGVHRCIGAPFAKLEIRIALEETLKRFAGFRLDPNQEIRMSSGGNQGFLNLPLILPQ